MILKSNGFFVNHGMRTILLSLLACSSITCASAAFAQPVANMGPESVAAVQEGPSDRQLSSETVQQQVPQTLVRPEDSDVAAPAAANGDEAVADAPVAEDAPAMPQQRKLVPARPMGAAAQNASTNMIEAQAPSAAPPGVAETPDISAAQTQAPVDPLERWTRKSAAAANQSARDSLPAVNADTMNIDDGLNADIPVVDGSLADAEAPDQKAKEQQEIRNEAFDAALTGMFPLTTGQIERLLQRHDETQRAAKARVYDAPRPEISVINLSLDPGVMPATIKTAIGNVTTINILDATGAPWPVQDVTWAGNYEIVEPEEGGHIIRITPMAEFSRGNMVIRLLTLKTPVTLTLETGRDVVQYRVDARIPEYGPFAATPIMQGAKSSMVAGSPALTSLLDGVMPRGMTKLNVAGVDGRTTAYLMGGTTYVRTPLTLLSPSWQSSVASADGMNVYALSSAPVVLLSDGGDFVRATLSEKRDLLDE